MVWLVIGLVIFFGTHLFSAFRSRAPGRDLKEKLGYGPYMGLYSLITIAGFVLIICGYVEARPSQIIYTPPVWGRHLNYALMLPALIALVAAYGPRGYIAKTLKHPMLAAVKIWALGHLLANGDLASLLLFGSFLAYGVIDRIVLKRRGDIGAGAVAKPNVAGDAIAVIVGSVAYAAILFWLHQVLFGVPVWPIA